MEFIKRDNKVYVQYLSELFNVAEETIRRDLARLETEGLLTRTYGGAVSNDPVKEDPSFLLRHSTNIIEKQYIALKVAELIKDNSTIMVDASSTALEAVYALTKKKNLTIITTSVKLTSDFTNSNFNIICTGGILRSHSSSLIGPLAINAVKNYHVDMAIIGCKSLSLIGGVMESNEAECEIKKVMINQSAKVVVLADHSKLDKVSFVKLLGFNEIDYVITDRQPADNWLALFAKNNVNLIY